MWHYMWGVGRAKDQNGQALFDARAASVMFEVGCLPALSQNKYCRNLMKLNKIGTRVHVTGTSYVC